VVQAIVAGEHVAYGHGRQIIRHALKTKQFKGDQQRDDRAVRYAAEHAEHAADRCQLHRQAEQRADHAAERRTNGEGGNDPAVLEADAQRERGKDHLQ